MVETMRTSVITKTYWKLINSGCCKAIVFKKSTIANLYGLKYQNMVCSDLPPTPHLLMAAGNKMSRYVCQVPQKPKGDVKLEYDHFTKCPGCTTINACQHQCDKLSIMYKQMKVSSEVGSG